MEESVKNDETLVGNTTDVIKQAEVNIKKRIFNFLVIVILGVLSYYGYNTVFGNDVQSTKNTEVYVVNETDSAVVVYLTFGADTNYLTNVNGVFGITTSGMQGNFTLGAGDTVFYKNDSTTKGFSGNISFGTPPVNCPDTTLFPYGINIFECSLNNNFANLPYAQETIDISCVSGVNSKIGVKMTDTTWTSQDTLGIQSFENSYLYSNVYRYGVFPFGCDSCTVIKNPPVCPNQKKFSQPQSKSICNIQRSANLKGGKVYISFKGYLSGVVN